MAPPVLDVKASSGLTGHTGEERLRSDPGLHSDGIIGREQVEPGVDIESRFWPGTRSEKGQARWEPGLASFGTTTPGSSWTQDQVRPRPSSSGTQDSPRSDTGRTWTKITVYTRQYQAAASVRISTSRETR